MTKVLLLNLKAGKTVNYKELGITGVKLPEIGLGTWLYRGDAKALQYGMSLGATFIDTAEIYGTEDVVGEAIKGRREQVFLALRSLQTTSSMTRYLKQ